MSLRHTIERRCVVCHGCYDAPCQLRLGSDDGISRGASKERIYDPSRLKNAPLTRLGIDASTTRQWRDLGFFNVLPGREGSQSGQSIMQHMLALGRNHPLTPDAPLPGSIDLDIKRQHSCPAPAEMSSYERRYPFSGMPYGMAPLSDNEWSSLSTWLDGGAPPLQQDQVIDPSVTAKVSAWETFLNGSTNRERLVSRYLYEHLFLAHLHVTGSSGDVFFEMVRSRTPPGQPIDIVATRRPYDDPGVERVYYRLKPIDGTILHKTHIVYDFDPRRMDRYRELFFAGDWEVSELPGYQPEVASNPFVAFSAIPASARYAFLLDEAEYFIRAFIRGPVCRGQVAVDVIEDRFWVMFLAPDADLSVTDPAYLKQITPYLGLPAQRVDEPLPERLAPAYLSYNRQYQDLRRAAYTKADPDRRGPSMDDLWPGREGAGATVLTVFRNLDNATVIGGFVGDTPETAWVIDFPILERIYYNLVAGFDVFGPIEHQLSTRIYMDLLRMEGEDLFLSFLPADVRRPLHDEWYRGGRLKVRIVYKQPPIDIETGTQVVYAGNDPKAELLRRAYLRDRSVAIKTDPLNRAGDDRAMLPSDLAALTALSSTQAPWVRYLPDVMLLRISGDDRVVAFVHNKAHANVAYLFAESLRREPEEDTVTLIEGPFGSYPNFFVTVDEAGLPDFISDLQGVTDRAGWLDFVAAYGVRRSSPEFWQTADFFQDVVARNPPKSNGLLDLNRYRDP